MPPSDLDAEGSFTRSSMSNEHFSWFVDLNSTINLINLVSQMFLSTFTIYNKYISSLYSLIYTIMESGHIEPFPESLLL